MLGPESNLIIIRIHPRRKIIFFLELQQPVVSATATDENFRDSACYYNFRNYSMIKGILEIEKKSWQVLQCVN